MNSTLTPVPCALLVIGRFGRLGKLRPIHDPAVDDDARGSAVRRHPALPYQPWQVKSNMSDMARAVRESRKAEARTAATTPRKLSIARKPFYSPSEIAQTLGISTQTVLDRIHEGALYAVRLSPRIYRVPLAAFLQFLGEPPRITHRVTRVRRLPDWEREFRSEGRSR